MSLEHDKRARKPPAPEATPEGLEKPGKIIEAADIGDLDIRSGQKRVELGRNPRGESVSVSETITRYKKKQARRFAEHSPDSKRETRGTDANANGSPPPTRENGDKPIINRTSEIRAVPQNGEHPVSYFENGSDIKNRRGSETRLLFDERQPNSQDISKSADIINTPADNVKSSEILSGLSVDEQPQAPAISPYSSLPNRNAISHKRSPRSKQKRQGRLQTNRSRTADVPKNKRFKNKQRDAARFLPPDKINPDKTITPVIAGTLEKQPQTQNTSADIIKPGTEYDANWRRADDPAGTLTEYDGNPRADSGIPIATDNFSADVPAPKTGHNAVISNLGSDAGSKIRLSEQNGGANSKNKPVKLNFGDENDTPDGKKAKKMREKAEEKLGRSAKKIENTQRKTERSSKKLDKAREKLPTKRKLRANREFDAEKGKLKPRLRFEKEVKTQGEHLKGSPVTRPAKFAAGSAVNFAHVKIYQSEDDNVAVKAAHRSELIAERGAHSAYRFAKNTPYRKADKIQRRTEKLNHKTIHQKAAHQKREVKAGQAAKKAQKKLVKKQYAKTARDAQKAGKTTAKAAVKVKAFAAKVGAKIIALAANPKVWIIGGILALIIIIILGVVSACSSMFSGIGSSITAMSYLSEDDADIDDAELYYTEMETDLQILIANAENDHPDYDEYKYYIDGIEHDPYMLLAFLTAVYEDFTFADIKPVLEQLFAEQYQLELTPGVEIRYTEPDEDGDTEPYDWRVLTVTLTSRSFFDVIFPRMDSEQLEHYALLMQSKGLRQYAASPFAFNWLPFVSSNYGYRVHPITGEKDYHLGIDIALPTGTEILAAHTGKVTFAGELGGYGFVVVIEDSDGLVTKYAHCSELFVTAGQMVTASYVIAAVGNTGDSTGSHLHFEVIKNGRYLNPLFFAFTSNY